MAQLGMQSGKRRLEPSDVSMGHGLRLDFRTELGQGVVCDESGHFQLKVQEMLNLAKLRDDVNGGVKRAQLVATDMQQLRNAAGPRKPKHKCRRLDMLQTPPRQK